MSSTCIVWFRSDLRLADNPALTAAVGRGGAQGELKKFMESGAEHYPEARDRLAAGGVSRLSPHLHFGELSPRQLWNSLRVEAKERRSARLRKGVDAYLRQIVWREFARHLLFHFPNTVTQPFNPRFKKFPWKTDKRRVRAWWWRRF